MEIYFLLLVEQGWTGQLSHSGECPKGELHGVGKMLKYEYGELHNVYMKELTLKLDLSENCSLLQYLC